MSVLYMDSVNISNYQQRNEDKAWEIEVELGEVADSAWIIIPGNVQNIYTALIFSNTATAKVQTTNNLLADVIAGSGVVAFDTAGGAVSANTQEEINPPTAVRLSVTAWTSGTVKLILRAQ